jgi:predicted small lipoprotein YifL
MPLERNALAVIALGLLALGCAGCGQKGALYLPDRQPQAVPAAPDSPVAQPAPGATDPAAEPKKQPAGK